MAIVVGLVEPLGILCTDEPPVEGVGRCSRPLGPLSVVLKIGYKFLGLIGPLWYPWKTAGGAWD